MESFPLGNLTSCDAKFLSFHVGRSHLQAKVFEAKTFAFPKCQIFVWKSGVPFLSVRLHRGKQNKSAKKMEAEKIPITPLLSPLHEYLGQNFSFRLIAYI